MAPLTLVLSLPAAEIFAAGWLWQRIPARRYPALLCYLLADSMLHLWAAVPGQYADASMVGMAPRLALLAWVTVEACRRARASWGVTEARSMSVWAAGAVGLATVAACSNLSPLTSWFVARQYAYLSLASVLWALIIRCVRTPVLEHPRDRAYRWGMAAWVSVLGIGSSFTPGGIGFAIVRPGPLWWGTVQTGVIVSLIAVTIGLCAAMGAGAYRPRRNRPQSMTTRGRVLEFRRAA